MFKSILDTLPCMVAFWDTDLRCHFANAAYLEWFGRDPETMTGMTLPDLLGADLFKLNEPFILQALSGCPQTFERTLIKADGTVGHTLAHYIPQRNRRMEVVGFSVQVSDVTTFKRAEAAERLAAKVYESLAEAVIIQDESEKIISVNPAFSKITGFSQEDVIGKTTRVLGSARVDEDFRRNVVASIKSDGYWKGEIWSRRKDGVAFLASQTSSILRGSTERYVSIFSDATERWANEARQRELALRDPLTGLANRTLLFHRIETEIERSKNSERRFAVLFLDLDGFKGVNDCLGHDIGDQVLKQVAQSLVAEVRGLDMVARLGGDEFVIVLGTGSASSDANRIAARILTCVKKPISAGGRAAQVSASIGISFFPDHGTMPDALIRAADTAMYSAKRTGKDRIVFAGHGKDEQCLSPPVIRPVFPALLEQDLACATS